jgi:hypothetical protein
MSHLKKYGYLPGIALLLVAMQSSSASSSTPRLDAAKTIVAAVNKRDSALYASTLADNVVVAMYGGEVRLTGRDAVKKNRENHFRTHPEVRNEIVHLVEIDNRVIMHDRVWLNSKNPVPADIVEVFTFEGDKIVRIDVVQPKDLFSR